MTAPISYDTLDDVKESFGEGDIERADAIQVLMEEFDMTEEDAIALVDTWPEEDDEDA